MEINVARGDFFHARGAEVKAKGAGLVDCAEDAVEPMSLDLDAQALADAHCAAQPGFAQGPEAVVLPAVDPVQKVAGEALEQGGGRDRGAAFLGKRSPLQIAARSVVLALAGKRHLEADGEPIGNLAWVFDGGQAESFVA